MIPSNVVHHVYWTDPDGPKFADFLSGDLDGCLKQCETLRKLRKDGHDISFITISSEIPECVSLPGVDVVGPDYDWKKRRP